MQTHLLPLDGDDLEPTYTTRMHILEGQRATMRRLRELENQGRLARGERDGLLAAQAMSGSLSRPDMARAIGLSRSAVDQIIARYMDRKGAREAAAAAERVARHSR